MFTVCYVTGSYFCDFFARTILHFNRFGSTGKPCFSNRFLSKILFALGFNFSFKWATLNIISLLNFHQIEIVTFLDYKQIPKKQIKWLTSFSLRNPSIRSWLLSELNILAIKFASIIFCFNWLSCNALRLDWSCGCSGKLDAFWEEILSDSWNIFNKKGMVITYELNSFIIPISKLCVCKTLKFWIFLIKISEHAKTF